MGDCEHGAVRDGCALCDFHLGVLAENKQLRAALAQACRDAWSDPQAAMEHYLTTANDNEAAALNKEGE